MKLLLQHRILIGYIILIAVIGSMAATMFHERSRVNEIEGEFSKIREANKNINTAHRHITVLATLGESVMAWDEEDYQRYQVRRLKVDSLLEVLQRDYSGFIPVEQIETFRIMLANKEKHLYYTMKSYQYQDSLLLQGLPSIINQTRTSRTVIRKKKGIAGFFGAKETVKVPVSSNSQQTLNRQLISRQQQIINNTDSLRVQNKELNRKLYTLIQNMDEQSQIAFQIKEQHIKESYERSTIIVTVLIVSAIILLLFFYWIIQRDIKEKERAKNRQEELIDSRKKTMHSITHELRTPLAAIHGYAELIQKNNVETRINRYSEHIRLSSQRMLAMLNSLLDFFRLDNSKEQSVPSPFRLEDIAHTLKVEFQNMAESKNLCLAIENNADIVLMGDKNRILQIGNNLLSNAIKFTENGGVSMTTDYNNGVLTLVVEDTGTGMTEDEQLRIFTAFERLSNATAQDGFGLGLSVVKQIVDMLKGTIDVQSEKGKGSRFTVRLPMPVADTILEEKIQGMTDRHILKPCSVLVLDDNETLLSMIKEMYAHTGVCCDAFDNVGDIMEAMRKRNYDLLVTDMKMPEMNGYEVLELLRSSNIGNARDIPIIVATASGSCNVLELIERGFAGCLFKPFTLEELIAATENALKTKPNDDLPDLKPLLAYGDSGVMLDRLIAETEKDMQDLGKAGVNLDSKALADLSHRLRSSWAVIRADSPLWLLHGCIQSGCSDAELQQSVKAVLKKGDMIIELAKEERRKYDNG